MGFVVKRYAVREAKKWLYAVLTQGQHSPGGTQYAKGGCHPPTYCFTNYAIYMHFINIMTNYNYKCKCVSHVCLQ